MRRLRPDSSLLRLAAELARRPRLVGRQASRFGSELARIAAGRSAIAPEMGTGPRDRRFADPAWTGNPMLRRSVQAYLAAAQSAEALMAGAELGWRDDTRLRFLLATAAPSNNPVLSRPPGRPSSTPAAGAPSAACAPRHRPGAPGCRRWWPPTPSKWAGTWR